MPSITVRNLDAALKDRLRAQAAKHGCSMEEEARNILESALPEPLTPGNGQDSSENLAEAIRKRFEPLGGMELELPSREKPIKQPDEPEHRSPDTPPEGLGTAIHNLFKPLGGVELELPPREKLRLDQQP